MKNPIGDPLSSIVQIFLYKFDLVRLPKLIELNPWIKFDLVRLSSIEIQFDWVRLSTLELLPIDWSKLLTAEDFFQSNCDPKET